MSLPSCYGKDWDQNDAVCAGGRDPAYVGPDGSHIRQRCDLFNTCGARLQAKQVEEQQQRLLPVSSLLRGVSQSTTSNPVVRPTVQTAPVAQGNQEALIQQLTAQLAQAQQLLQQQQAMIQQRQMGQMQPGVGMHPMMPMMANQLQMMAMEMSVPKYLTVPEPKRKEMSIWAILGREMFRAMMKSAGHTVANFWDHTPFDRDE